MNTLRPEKPVWLAALRIILLVVIVMLLLPALAPVQPAWPSEGLQVSLAAASGIRSNDIAPPGLRSNALDQENPGCHLASLSAPAVHRDVTVRPAILGRLPRRWPLPPASAFPLQTNLRKYLEIWPKPGSTVSEAWPEYIPEDGEDVD